MSVSADPGASHCPSTHRPDKQPQDKSASRRSFMGRLGKVAMIVSGASLIEALELAAPSATALASHCNGGYHAGASCANQTSCAANGCRRPVTLSAQSATETVTEVGSA